MKPNYNHLRANSWEMLQPSIAKFSLKITYLKFDSILSGANELSTNLDGESTKIWILNRRFPHWFELSVAVIWHLLQYDPFWPFRDQPSLSVFVWQSDNNYCKVLLIILSNSIPTCFLQSYQGTCSQVREYTTSFIGLDLVIKLVPIHLMDSTISDHLLFLSNLVPQL